jgi:hypothetical protein
MHPTRSQQEQKKIPGELRSPFAFPLHQHLFYVIRKMYLCLDRRLIFRTLKCSKRQFLPMNIISTIIIIGIVNGILEGIALLVFVHRGNRRANRILGFLVIILAFCVSGMLLMSLGIYTEYPHFLLITQPFLFLFGPLFWLYIQLVTHRIETFRLGLLYHAIPFILCTLYLVPFYISSAMDKIMLLERWSSLTSRSDLLITGIQLIHIVIYLVLVLRQVRVHQLAIRKEYSSIEKINLTWVRIFVISVCIVSFVMALFLLLDLFGFQSFVHTSSGLLGVLLPLGLGY